MTDPIFNEMTVRFYSTSAKMASNLEYQGIFTSQANMSARALFLEAFLSTDAMVPAYKTVNGEQVILYYVGKAFGFQFSLEVGQWDSNMNLSLAAVAAQAQFGGTALTYHLELLGLPKVLENEFIHALGGATGSLNEDTYARLRELITVTLPNYLRRPLPEDGSAPTSKQRAALAVSDIKVPVAGATDQIDISRQISLAVTHVSRGDNLDTARKEMKTNPTTAIGAATEDALQVVYKRLAGISPDRGNDHPSPEAKAKARRWLDFQEKFI